MLVRPLEVVADPGRKTNRPSLLAPYRKLVAGRIAEVEAASAREREDRLDDRAAGRRDRLEARFQILRIEDRQRRRRRLRSVRLEPAVHAFVEGGVGRP